MSKGRRRMWKYRTKPRKGLSPERFANSYIYKAMRNQKKLEYKARTGRLRGQLLDTGFYVDQTWGGLHKAWLAYTISCKHEDWERRKYYAAVINKLERELKIAEYDFEEIRDMAADFLSEYSYDPDIQNMSIEEIEEIMKKSDTEFWRSVRGEES